MDQSTTAAVRAITLTLLALTTPGLAAPEGALTGRLAGAGPLPQHRGVHTGANYIDAMRWGPGGLLLIGREALTLLDAADPVGAPPRWQRPLGGQRAALAPDGAVIHLGWDDGRVAHLLDPAGQTRRQLRHPRLHAVAFCGARPVVAFHAIYKTAPGVKPRPSGPPVPPLAWWSADGLEAIGDAPESPHQLACAGGRLAVSTQRAVHVLDLERGVWGPGLPATDSIGQPPYGVALSPDGRYVAAITHLGALRLWETRAGDLVGAIPRVGGQASTVAFSPDGQQLAAGAHRLSVPDLRLLDTWHGQVPGAVAWSPDGRWLAHAGGHTLRLLDRDGRDRSPISHGPRDTVRSMATDAKRGRLYTLDESGQLHVWTLDPLQVVGGFVTGELGPDVGRRLAVLPDGTLLIGQSNGAQRWTPDGRRLEFRLHPGHTGDAISASADGQRVAMTTSNGAWVFDWATDITRLYRPSYKKDGEGFDGSAESIALHPDGRVVAIAGRRVTHVLDVLTGAELARVPTPEGSGNRVLFDPTGTRLVHTNYQAARLYAWPGLKVLGEMEDLEGADSLVFAPDGRALLAGDWGGSVTVVDLEPEPKTRWSGRGPWHVGAIAWDPHAERVFTAGPDHHLIAWDRQRGEALTRRPTGVGRRAVALQFSPDGRHLAFANAGGEVMVFDLRHHQPVLITSPGEGIEHEWLAFPPGGGLVGLTPGPGLHRWPTLPGAATPRARPTRTAPDAYGRYSARGGFTADAREAVALDLQESQWLHFDTATGQMTSRPLPKALTPPEGAHIDEGLISPDGRWWLRRTEVWAPERRYSLDLVRLADGEVTAPFTRPEEIELLDWVGDAAYAWLHRHEAPSLLIRWAIGAPAPERIEMPGWAWQPTAISSTHLAWPDRDAVIIADHRGAVQQVLVGHDARVDGVAFSRDGERVATADFFGQIRVWEIATGRALARYQVSTTGAWSAWSAEGAWRAAGYGAPSAP